MRKVLRLATHSRVQCSVLVSGAIGVPARRVVVVETVPDSSL
eukprot:SAG31_NODE_19359_length_604_cov_43.148515_1_plen_41_part_10